MAKHQNAGASGSRRRFLGGAAAVPLASLANGLIALPVFAADKAIAGHKPALVPSVDTLASWLKTLHNFGPQRFTGTPNARAFEDWLAAQFAALGCKIERDEFRLTSWVAQNEDCSIVVKEDGGASRTLDVLAYYPFSASTDGKSAVTGRVLFGGTGNTAGEEIVAKFPAAELAQSIVVVDIPIRGKGADSTVKSFPESFPGSLPKLVDAPNPASLVQIGIPTMAALENRCRGVIFCYTDVSKDSVRYNFLPFTDRFRNTTGLFVGADDSAYLKQVSGKATATMRLDAKLTHNARTDSILATLPGETDEVVIITTETDGPNEVNENGPLGVLAAATYLSKLPKRRRTFVFSLPTAHYAIGPVLDAVTGSGRRATTSGMMAKYPDVVDRTVAQIALEQMGAMEWADVDGKWQATGRPAVQHWIPTPSAAPAINKMFMAATRGENPALSRSDLIESGFPGGEGGSLRARDIPGIGLMGWPHYFFRADPKGVLDKLSPEVMHSQVSIVTKLVVLMDRLTPAQMKGTSPITEKDISG